MSEGPAKPDITQRLNRASILLTVSFLSFVCVWEDTGKWVAGPLFLLAVNTAFGGIGAAFGYWRTGTLIGLLIGALYLVYLFSSMKPDGGFYMPGWPIEIAIE